MVPILAALLLGAQPTTAATPASASTSTEAATSRQAAALALARLYIPADTMMDAELNAFDTQFEAQVAKNPEVAALEKKAPGAISAMARAARPILRQVQAKKIERAQAGVAELFVKRLNDRDMAELTAFYQLPGVRSALRKIAMGVDASKTMEKVALDPDYQVDKADLRRNIDTGVANAEGALTAAEKAAINSLEAKPAYKRLAELDSDIASVILATRNGGDPESDRLIQDSMRKAVEEHMAAAAATGSPVGE
jgi:hypothetical protein